MMYLIEKNNWKVPKHYTVSQNPLRTYLPLLSCRIHTFQYIENSVESIEVKKQSFNIYVEYILSLNVL